jgi:F-type H+-transporting ATPase subunit b
VLIDWFTVAAQIVNFLVLVALLKHFLYGPLIAAIDAREQRVARCLTDAAQKEKEAAAHIAESARQASEIERDRAGLLASARTEADRQRGEILTEARSGAKALEAKWHDELEREKAAFFDELRHRAAEEILEVTRAALRDLACPDVQRCALRAFVAKLNTLDPAALRTFAAHGMTVVSQQELPADMREEVRGALAERLAQPVELTFERVPDMAWGVELRGDGQRIGWTPDAYLDSLEERLRAALDRAATGFSATV